MKALADGGSKHETDFYTATLAPVNQQRARRIAATDAVLLVVLFLEMFALVRFLLAS